MAHVAHDQPRLVAQIDLDAIAGNWQKLNALSGKAEAAAVVKADAYGHGMAAVSKALYHAGCRLFFTASITEAIKLRHALPMEANIAYLDGLHHDDIKNVIDHRLWPAISAPYQIKNLAAAARLYGAPIKAMLQLDTGMNRLGISPQEFKNLLTDPDMAAGDWRLVFSHLSSSDEPQSPNNPLQKSRFDEMLKYAPPAILAAPRSLAATGGIMLGSDYHYDITRPGIGLYGVMPSPLYDGGLIPALTLSGRVLQIRDAKAGESVGYNAALTLNRDSRLATIAGGYADGINRRLSNIGTVTKDALKAPIIGKISMDLHVIDITDWPENSLKTGDYVTHIGNIRGGDSMTAEEIAEKTGTISYDILTTLGLRATRLYTDTITNEIDLNKVNR